MRTIILTTILLLFGCSFVKLSEGWRFPNDLELAASPWRSRDPQKFLKVNGDFDGDKKTDVAVLLYSDSSKILGVQASLSSSNKTPVIITDAAEGGLISSMGIELVKAGTSSATSCGKGLFDCAKGQPKNVTTTADAINYFSEGGSNSWFIFNQKTKSFDRIWITD